MDNIEKLGNFEKKYYFWILNYIQNDRKEQLFSRAYQIIITN